MLMLWGRRTNPSLLIAMNWLLLIQKVITLAYGNIDIHWKHTLLNRKTGSYLVRVYTALITEEMIVLANEIQVNIYVEVNGVQKDIRATGELEEVPNVKEDILELTYIALIETGISEKEIVDYFSRTKEEIQDTRLDRIKDKLNDSKGNQWT